MGSVKTPIFKRGKSMTRNGIEYDLKKSPFIIEIDGVIFHFSSKWHKLKFTQDYKINRDKIRDALFNKFSIYVTADNLADVVLYSKIETRGFLLEIAGEEICRSTLKLDTLIAMNKNSQKR